MMWYYVSEANSYLAVTGAGIDRVKISKKCLVLPFQKVTRISITPFDFSMSIQAMTSEKLQFALPAVFTIGPEDSVKALQKYAVLLTGDSDGQVRTNKQTIATGRNHVQDIVKGIIEGEARSIVSNMTMEELFRNRRLFKAQVIECVQKELDQFGLRVYNANVKELQDYGDSKYFESLAMKAREGAVRQAQVDVASARMMGLVGEAEREGETKQKIAVINAQTAVGETERKVEKADAEKILKAREIEIHRDLQLEQIAADRAAQQRDAELQKEVETRRAGMELERLRATNVVQAKINRESAQEKADADYYSKQKKTDAQVYDQIKEAESIFVAAERKAEADYLTRKKEAQGMKEMAEAYGDLAKVFGGPQGLLQYLMLQKGTYTELARANAAAINGLQPKINVWNTGSQNGTADSMAPIRNLIQTLPPMLSTIQEQTGMTAPSWLMGHSDANGGISADEKAAAKQKILMGDQK